MKTGKRLLAIFLVVTTLFTIFPVGVSAVSVSEITLRNEDYYRLLHINQIEVQDTSLHAYEQSLDLDEIAVDPLFRNLHVVSSLVTASLGVILNKTPFSGIFKSIGCAERYFYLNQSNKQMFNQLSDRLETVYSALQKGLEQQTQEINGKIDTVITVIEKESYVNRFQSFYNNAFSDGKKDVGYLAWKDYLFSCYDDLVNIQASGSAKDIKIAYDRLYNSANQSDVLGAYLTDDQYISDLSILEIMYRYYLLRVNTDGDITMEAAIKDCTDCAIDFYTTFMFAETCRTLCYHYQMECIKANYGDKYTTGQYCLESGASDPFISYSAILSYFNDESNIAKMAKNVPNNIISYLMRILNLDAVYQTQHRGSIQKVLYETLSFIQDGNGLTVKNRKINGSPIYYYLQNHVYKGDTLYLSTLPDSFKNIFNGDFTFVSDKPGLASVTNTGVVNVSGSNGTFKITMLYENLPVYSMSFEIDSTYSFIGGGLGTADSPYIITTAEELQRIASDSIYWAEGYYYQLGRDIDLTNISIGQIGSSANPFKGNFDGNYHSISNLSGKSLFGFNQGIIKNLTVQNSSISNGYLNCASYYIGGIAIQNKGTISNCKFLNSAINADNPSHSVSGDVYYRHMATYVGGICAVNCGTLSQCNASGNYISGSQYNDIPSGGGASNDITTNAGGIAGLSESGTIMTDCLSSNNTIYQYIKSNSYYVCIWYLFVKDHYACEAVFNMGNISGVNHGTATRCLSYQNSITYGWDHDTIHASGNTDFWKDDGYCYPNINTTDFALSGISSSEKKKYENAGWIWGTMPVLSNNAPSSSISVEKLPNQISYYKNDLFNIDGMILKTDTGLLISDGFQVSNPQLSSLGEKKVTVTWNGMSTSFDIEVACPHTNIRKDEVKANENSTNVQGICQSCNQTVYSYYLADNPSDVDDTPPQDNPETPPATEDTPTIIIEDVTTHDKKDVKVKVALRNNPGIASMKIKLMFDNSLITLKKVEFDMAGEGQSYVSQTLKSPVILNWFNGIADTSGDLTYATLTFEIPETVPSGTKIPVTLSYDSDDVFNIAEKNIAFATQNGTICFSSYKPGDISGDGNINNKDLTRLFQHLSGWDVKVTEEALDINADGSINNKDLVRLFQYLSGWDVQIY